MKKIVVIPVLLLLLLPSLRAQDTVQYGDSWYAFNPLPVLSKIDHNAGAIWSFARVGVVYGGKMQMYENHGYTIYGIALTTDTFPGEKFGGALTLTRGISYEYSPVPYYETTPEGVVSRFDSNFIHIMDYGITDTLNTWQAMVRKCVFDYHLGYDTAINEVNNGKDTFITTNCFEFYFDEPISLGGRGLEKYEGEVYDTFYVGTLCRWDNPDLDSPENIQEYYNLRTPTYGVDTACGQHWLSLNFDTSVSPQEAPTAYLSVFPNTHVQCLDYADFQRYVWGYIFPIVKLRCVPPEVSLTEQGGRPMVKWQQYDLEAPEGYEVAIGAPGSDPDTCLVVELDGLQHTLSGLASGEQYAVWVRKSCRYTTAGYDTIVWSDWSQPVTVGDTSTGGGSGNSIADVEDNAAFTLAPNPAHGTVVLTLAETAEGAELTLCDLGGRELRREQVRGTTHSLDVSALPTGVYLLKLTTPQGVAIRRLLVE